MTSPDARRSPLSMACVTLMTLIVIGKAFWLAMGISSVGFNAPMLLFAAALVSFIAATWLLATGTTHLGLCLAFLGVAIAFFAGKLGGVTPGPGYSRFEEQYRNHLLSLLFFAAATAQYWLLLKRDRTLFPTPNA